MQLKLKKTLSNDNHGSYSAGRSRINQISLGVSQNDSILVDQINNSIEPAFQTQNYLYELQSKCNNLQYQKTKINITHQNIINELKHRNQQLQKLTNNLTAQNTHLTHQKDRFRNTIQEKKKVNYQLNRQNNALKIEIQNIQKNNQNHNSTCVSRESVIHMEEELIQTKELLQMKNEEISRLKIRITKLTQSSSSMKEDSIAMLKQRTKELQREKLELMQKLQHSNLKLDSTKYINNESRNTVKENEELRQEVEQLQHDKAQLFVHLEELQNKERTERRSSMTPGNESLRRIKQTLTLKQLKLKEVENEREHWEKKTNELNLQFNRITSQKNSLEQQNRYLQECNSQNALNIKTMQDQLCENQKQISQLKSQMLTLRLQNKKMIGSLKLQFQQQRLKNIHSIQQKEKHINQLKELQFSWRKQSGEHIFDNKIEELQKKSKQIQNLKMQGQQLKKENDVLRNETRKMQIKYESKQNKLQKQFKGEYQKLYPLHPEADRFQFQSVQIPSKSLQDMSIFKCSQLLNSIKDQKNQDLIELLKIEKKEQAEQIRELLKHEKQKNQVIAQIEKEIQEIRTSKAHEASINNKEKHDKQRIINELNQEINIVNEELKRERINNEQQRQEIHIKEQKWLTETESLWQECETLKQTNSNLIIKIQQLQTELQQKDVMMTGKDDEIAKLTTEIENNKICENYFETKIEELQVMLQLLKSGKQIENNQKNQLSNTVAVTDGKYKAIQSSQESLPVQTMHDTKQSNQELYCRISELQSQNYNIKCTYSESLQQINMLLLRYRNLEDKYKQLIQECNNLKYQQSGQTFRGLRQNKSAKEFIKNCEIHISTSNQILMKNSGGRHHQSSKHLHNATHNDPSFFDRRDHDPSSRHNKPQKQFKRTHPFPYYPQHDHIRDDSHTNTNYSYMLRPYHE